MINNTNIAYLDEAYYATSDFRKSNLLINSRFRAGLLENQLLAFCLSTVKDTADGLQAHLTAGQIMKILGKNYNDFYSQLKRAAQNLLKLTIMMENPEEKVFEGKNVISSVRTKNGDFSVEFNYKLKDQILNLRSNYTILSITMLSKFDRVSTFRLYETLKSRAYYPKTYKGVQDGKFIFLYSISELRCMLNGVDLNHPVIAGLFQKSDNPDYDKIINMAKKIHNEDVEKGKAKKDQYPAPKWESYGELMRQAIMPAIKEINEKSDIYVEANAVKQGQSHKAVAVEFFILDKKCSEEDKNIPDATKEMNPDEILELALEVKDIISEKISTKDIKAIMAAADNDLDKIQKAYDVAKTQNVDNLTGFMISAIKNGYENPVKSEKRINKKLSGQRNYDFDELERQLINK